MQTLRRTLCTAIFSLLFLITATDFLSAQGIPRTISYQGVLAMGGTPISDGQHTLEVKVYGLGGSELFVQTLVIQTRSGLFSTTLGPFPGSLIFDAAYTLGIAVDGAAEFTPRTPLTSSPYALRAITSASSELANRALLADRSTTAGRADVATVADALSPQASGVVKDVNGIAGEIEIVGGTGVVISEENGKILITLDDSNFGIQEIRSSDSVLVVTPSGSIVSLELAENSIREMHIQDGAIATAKLRDDAVTSDKIENRSISNEDLDDDIITTNKIFDGTIETQDIKNDAITSEKIGDDEVTLDKISHVDVEAGATLKFNGTTPYWQEVGTASISNGDPVVLDEIRDIVSTLLRTNTVLLERIALLEETVARLTAESGDDERRAAD